MESLCLDINLVLLGSCGGGMCARCLIMVSIVGLFEWIWVIFEGVVIVYVYETPWIVVANGVIRVVF